MPNDDSGARPTSNPLPQEGEGHKRRGLPTALYTLGLLLEQSTTMGPDQTQSDPPPVEPAILPIFQVRIRDGQLQIVEPDGTIRSRSMDEVKQILG